MNKKLTVLFFTSWVCLLIAVGFQGIWVIGGIHHYWLLEASLYLIGLGGCGMIVAVGLRTL